MAEEILQEFEKEMPKLVMIQLRQITLARRRGNLEKVDQLYTKYMEEAASEKERSFFAIKRARFQAKVGLRCVFRIVDWKMLKWNMPKKTFGSKCRCCGC